LGIEPVNFAFLTKSGVATSSADPSNGDRFNLSQNDYFGQILSSNPCPA